LREIAGPRPSPSFRLIQRPWPKGQHEFAVPICAFHQQQNHATGNEREWWREHKNRPARSGRMPVARKPNRSVTFDTHKGGSDTHKGGSGHITVRRGNRVTQLPSSHKELGIKLINKILKDLGLK
jgi:mRNA interferase HicA